MGEGEAVRETYAAIWPTKETIQPNPTSVSLPGGLCAAGISGRWVRGEFLVAGG